MRSFIAILSIGIFAVSLGAGFQLTQRVLKPAPPGIAELLAVQSFAVPSVALAAQQMSTTDPPEAVPPEAAPPIMIPAGVPSGGTPVLAEIATPPSSPPPVVAVASLGVSRGTGGEAPTAPVAGPAIAGPPIAVSTNMLQVAPATRFHVQAGVFEMLQDAAALSVRLQSLGYSVTVSNAGPLYRVWVGGYLDEPTAGRLVQELRKTGFEAGLTP